MKLVRENSPPYGSAHDLPRMIEMRQMISAMRWFSLLLRPEQREELRELREKVHALNELVDRFYAVLGDRHWIFTEHLPVSEVQALLADAPDSQAAETQLIEVISSRLKGNYWRTGLFGHEEMRVRHEQIERAREHYLAGQWDSCALMLITAMDGFINDVEPERRRGLHARKPEEMVAWDSLSGHHKALTAVMPVFCKPCKRRQDEEVFELHRHGIVHGTVVNYNNIVVATKAWNMLAAVVDWATATKAAALAPKAKPTWKDTLNTLRRLMEDRRYRENFRASTCRRGDSGFDELDVAKAAIAFLEAWRANRWALVADALPSIILPKNASLGKRAVLAKQIYGDTALVGYDLEQISFPMASCASVTGVATIGEITGPFELRWVLQRPNGDVARDDEKDARWMLAVYPPHTFIKHDSTEATPHEADCETEKSGA